MIAQINRAEPKLRDYASLILKWNKTINLISKNTEAELWHRHILDSAQLFDYLAPDDHVCDLGSGAGLPGIVLSIMGVKYTTLIESDVRKCAFLNQASLLSQNKIKIINERIENCFIQFESPVSVITSRALSSIDNLLHYSKIFRPTKSFLLLKGKNFRKELDEAMENWHFVHEVFQSSTNAESVILRIKNVEQKN